MTTAAWFACWGVSWRRKPLGNGKKPFARRRSNANDCASEGRLAEAIQRAESAIRNFSADPVLMELLRDLERAAR